MVGFGVFIDFFLMLSIGGLAGLVIALHLKLRQFSAEAGKVPALADDLTRAITASRIAMQELAQSAKTDGAHLENFVSQAERSRQDLIYILDRAEQVLTQFDEQLKNKPIPKLKQDTTSDLPQMNAGKQGEPRAPEASINTQSQPHGKNNQSVASGQDTAAIMPGRYKARFAVDQDGQPRPYKPASYGVGAAAYGASARHQVRDDEIETTEAVNDLRRALQNSI